MLSKCLTAHFEDFGWYSIGVRGLATLQLPDSLHGLCFCWRAIEGVNQGTLRRVLNCLVFDAGGLVQQLAEVCCPALQDVGFLRQKCAIRCSDRSHGAGGWSVDGSEAREEQPGGVLVSVSLEFFCFSSLSSVLS